MCKKKIINEKQERRYVWPLLNTLPLPTMNHVEPAKYFPDRKSSQYMYFPWDCKIQEPSERRRNLSLNNGAFGYPSPCPPCNFEQLSITELDKNLRCSAREKHKCAKADLWRTEQQKNNSISSTVWERHYHKKGEKTSAEVDEAERHWQSDFPEEVLLGTLQVVQVPRLFTIQ